MRNKFTVMLTIAIVFLLLGKSAYAKFPICTAPNWQSYPTIDNNIIVWDDQRNSNYDIFGYDSISRNEFEICTASGGQYLPAIDGDIVVWADNRNETSDIYGYNLDTQTEFVVCTAPDYQSSPAIDGNIIVWVDNRNGNEDIFGYNIDTQTEFEICTETGNQACPVIDGNVVVYLDERNGPPPTNLEVYGYNLETQTEFKITTLGSYFSSGVQISDNIVVWADVRNEDWNIYGYSLDTKTEFEIYTEVGRPVIDGNIVVWSDIRNGNYDIYGYNLDTQIEFPVCVDSVDKYVTDINGNIVVFTQGEGELCDVYASDISGNNECFNAVEVFKNISYYGSTSNSYGGESMTSCGYNDYHDVWHRFLPAETGKYTVSLCGSNFDTTVAVYGKCDGEEISCNDDYCGEASQVDFKAKTGKEYIIRVAGYDGDKGDYILNITTSTKCIEQPRSDLSGDCKVDLKDIAIISSDWLNCGFNDPNLCQQYEGLY